MFDFERIIAGLFANEVSRFFTIAILAYLSFSILLLFRKRRGEKLNGLVDISPGILTSLGILGTFLGIFLGLMDFDIRTINRSVPELLEGLKVAFGTSILGLGGALIFRVARPLVTSSSGNPVDRPKDEARVSSGAISCSTVSTELLPYAALSVRSSTRRTSRRSTPRQ